MMVYQYFHSLGFLNQRSQMILSPRLIEIATYYQVGLPYQTLAIRVMSGINRYITAPRKKV